MNMTIFVQTAAFLLLVSWSFIVRQRSSCVPFWNGVQILHSRPCGRGKWYSSKNCRFKILSLAVSHVLLCIICSSEWAHTRGSSRRLVWYRFYSSSGTGKQSSIWIHNMIPPSILIHVNSSYLVLHTTIIYRSLIYLTQITGTFIPPKKITQEELDF